MLTPLPESLSYYYVSPIPYCQLIYEFLIKYRNIKRVDRMSNVQFSRRPGDACLFCINIVSGKKLYDAVNSGCSNVYVTGVTPLFGFNLLGNVKPAILLTRSYIGVTGHDAIRKLFRYGLQEQMDSEDIEMARIASFGFSDTTPLAFGIDRSNFMYYFMKYLDLTRILITHGRVIRGIFNSLSPMYKPLYLSDWNKIVLDELVFLKPRRFMRHGTVVNSLYYHSFIEEKAMAAAYVCSKKYGNCRLYLFINPVVTGMLSGIWESKLLYLLKRLE